MSEPIQNSDDSEHPQSDSNDAAGGAQSPPRPPFRVIIESVPPPPSPSEEQKAKENRTERREKWRSIVECIVGFFVIVYTIVSICLWIASRNTNRIALQGVTNADRNFRRDERAWVVAIRDQFQWPIGSNVVFPGHLTNTGKTPAKHVEMWSTAIVLNVNDAPEFTYTAGTGHPSVRTEADIFFPNAPPIEFRVPTFKKGTNIGETISMTKGLHSQLTGGQYFIVMHGKITYEDIFGTSHWQTYCNTFPPSLGI